MFGDSEILGYHRAGGGKMIGHTPGEWTTGKGNWSSRVMAPSRFDKTLVEIGHFSGNGREEDEANARLSAAAPYLLEALEFWLAYKGDDLDAEFHPLCLAAIARAKG